MLMDSCKVYTPIPLAAGIVEALGDDADANWLEPSFGKGAFIEALSRMGVPRERVRAIDLDDGPEPIDRHAATERGTDFLSWSLNTDERFDRIIGNPPYITYSKLPAAVQDATRRVSLPSEGQRPNGSSNLWFYFLCASLSLLKTGGSMGFVLPAAWEYADYAQSLRDHLEKNFQNHFILRCKKPLFSDVQDGSVVLVAQGYNYVPKKNARIECRDTKHVLQTLARIPSIRNRSQTTQRTSSSQGTRPISDFLHISIGAVTGHSRYFLMNESRRKELSLPIVAMRRVLTRSRQLNSPLISMHEWQTLCDADERVWLFRPPKGLLRHTAVSRYLKLDPDQGGCDRTALHVSRRPNWYSTVLPTAVHGFISGMSSVGPWISLNGIPSLCATNTLYTVTFERWLTLSDRYAVALALLSSHARETLESKCRVYPDGLKKHEPKDILSLDVLMPAQRRGVRSTYVHAAQELINGNAAKATRIADEFIALSTR